MGLSRVCPFTIRLQILLRLMKPWSKLWCLNRSLQMLLINSAFFQESSRLYQSLTSLVQGPNSAPRFYRKRGSYDSRCFPSNNYANAYPRFSSRISERAPNSNATCFRCGREIYRHPDIASLLRIETIQDRSTVTTADAPMALQRIRLGITIAQKSLLRSK